MFKSGGSEARQLGFESDLLSGQFFPLSWNLHLKNEYITTAFVSGCSKELTDRGGANHIYSFVVVVVY